MTEQGREEEGERLIEETNRRKERRKRGKRGGGRGKESNPH